ncbi:MAG: ImmA/IrrE family metallo-endopeptidase, partial [Endomicrobiales bacterium]
MSIAVAPVRIIPTRSIIDITKKCVNKYFQEMGWTHLEEMRIDLQELYESVIYPEYEYCLETGVDLGYDGDEKILGKTIPKDRVILIDKSLSSARDPRYTFTFGHEIGHGVLHPKERVLFRCSSRKMITGKDPLEIQANIFSQHLIMPDALVKAKFHQCYAPTKPFIYSGSKT